MADILEEQKNLAFIIFKRTYVYRTNRTPKDLIRQSKSLKRIKNFKPFNRRRKLNRGSNHNTFLKDDDDKASKDVETELESDPNPELESFICVIKNFDLNNSKSSYFTNSLSFKNNVKDFKTEDNYLVIFNKSKKSLKRSPNRLDLLLYKINIIDYIVNDKK